MLTSLLISLSLCTLTVCGFLIASAPTAHWVVVPVWLCVVLISRDAVDWFHGRLGLFDPPVGLGGRIPGVNNLGLLEAAVRGAARGARIFHLGGGVGSLPDSLFAFKASVGNRRAEYWTGQRIFAPVSYGQLCEARDRKT